MNLYIFVSAALACLVSAGCSTPDINPPAPRANTGYRSEESPKEMEAFKNKTTSVYDKWVKEIGAELVGSAEKVIKGVK